MRPEVLAVMALNALPECLGDDLSQDATFRLRYGLEADFMMVFKAGAAGTSRHTMYTAVRAALANRGPGEYTVEDRDRNPWRFEVVDGTPVRNVVLHPSDVAVVLPHSYALSADRAERWAGFEEEAQRLGIGRSGRKRWLDELEVGPLDDVRFTELNADLSATPEVIDAVIYQTLATRELSIEALVPDDDRYYTRLLGSPPIGIGDFREYSRWLSSKAQTPGVEADTLGWRALLHLAADHSIGLGNVPSDQLADVCDYAIGSGLIPRLAAIELLLSVDDDVADPLSARFEKLIVSLTQFEPSAVGSPFHRFVVLTKFTMGHMAARRQMPGAPAFARRLAAFAHASRLDKHFAAAGIELEAADFNAVTDETAFFFRAMTDFREENRWHADHLNPVDLKKWTTRRLMAAAHGHRDKKLGKLLVERLADDVAGGPLSLWQISSPDLLGGGSTGDRMIAEQRRNIETSLGNKPIAIEAFGELIWAAEVGWLPRDLAEQAAAAISDARYTISGSENPNRALFLLRGLAYASGVTKSEDLAAKVRILTRNLRERYGKISFEDEFRLVLICAAAFPDTDRWALFIEGWLTELSFTDITAAEAIQFRDATERLGHAAPEFRRISSRMDAILASVAWL